MYGSALGTESTYVRKVKGRHGPARKAPNIGSGKDQASEIHRTMVRIRLLLSHVDGLQDPEPRRLHMLRFNGTRHAQPAYPC